MTGGTRRIDAAFARLKREGRAGLTIFMSAGDPDLATSDALLAGLPAAGADIIELGMPFTDPMADGPAIQASSRRALGAGQTLRRTLDQVRRFRQHDTATPLVLMGYYNPIYRFGPERFLDEAKAAGVDGLIVVDLPPEEDAELCIPAVARGLAFIRLATPTTDAHRLAAVLNNTSGFLYYVTITGITGTQRPDLTKVAAALDRLRARTELPIAVGFGVRTAEQAAEFARIADAVVVGSAVVDRITATLEDGRATERTVPETLALVSELARGVRSVPARAGGVAA